MPVGFATGQLSVGYQNLLEYSTSTVTVSSEDSALPKENLLNRMRGARRWKSTDVDAAHWVKVDLGETDYASQGQSSYSSPGDWDATIRASGAFPPGRIQPGTLVITFPGPVVVTDDGAGGFTGTGVDTGASTVDYLTGVVSVAWTAAPSSGAVSASWTHDNGVVPDYLGLTDLKVNDLRDVFVGVTIHSSWDDSSWSSAGFSLNAWPVIFHPFDAGLPMGRYFRVEFGAVTVGTTVSATTVFLGRRLTFSEPMEAGFDPFDVSTKSVKAQAAGGLDLGDVVIDTRHRFQAKFGGAGIDASLFDDGGGGSSQRGGGPAAKGWSAEPSIGRWLRSYYNARRAHYVFHDGEDGAYVQIYGKGDGRVRTGYRWPGRRGLRVGWLPEPDKMIERDE